MMPGRTGGAYRRIVTLAKIRDELQFACFTAQSSA